MSRKFDMSLRSKQDINDNERAARNNTNNKKRVIAFHSRYGSRERISWNEKKAVQFERVMFSTLLYAAAA